MLNKFTNSISASIINIIGAILLLLAGTLTSHAQNNSSEQIRVPNNVLSGEALGEFENFRNDLMLRRTTIYTSSDGGYTVGIWETKTGSFMIENFPQTETIYIIEGGLMLNATDKDPIAYSAGEGVIIPKGWNGTFSVPQGGLKMIYAAYTDASQPTPEVPEIILMDRDTMDGKRFAEFRPFDADVSDIVARDHEFHRTSDDKFGADVWEAQPGQVPFADLGYDELIYVLEGNMTFVNRDGNAQIYGQGKAVVLPSGWSGTGVVSTNGARVLIMWYRHASGN